MSTLVAVAAVALAAGPPARLQDEVRRAETAFAQTMADRDLAAFSSFLSDEAIFVGPRATLRGKNAITEGWRRYYEGPAAPFSWRPDTVEVLDSGTLAMTSGPVHDPDGKRIGTFTSVWRREKGGAWKIILDKGCPPCESAAPSPSPSASRPPPAAGAIGPR